MAWLPFTSVQWSTYLAEKVPFLVGVKVTGTSMSAPGLNGIWAAGVRVALNGLASGATPWTALSVLPELVICTYAVAFLPTGMVPKFTTGLAAVNLLTAGTPVPFSWTVASGPAEVPMLSWPVSGPPVVGA